jgi:hypothetical protein
VSISANAAISVADRGPGIPQQTCGDNVSVSASSTSGWVVTSAERLHLEHIPVMLKHFSAPSWMPATSAGMTS